MTTAAEGKRVANLAENALRERLGVVTGSELDRAGRVTQISDATLSTIPMSALARALDDVGQGDGGELRPDRGGLAPRFHSARSSCAMVINAFAPWRLDPSSLTVFGSDGFHSLRFECKCPITGVSGRFPPNLDVLLEGPDVVLGIESKLIEYVQPDEGRTLERAYEPAIEALAHESWRDQIRRIGSEYQGLFHFRSAQIVKHYLGLKSCFSERPIRLVYVFWEPSDHEQHPLFEDHRREVARFAEGLSDPAVRFSFASYAEIFDEWAQLPDSIKVKQHLDQLRARYEVAIFST